jgi:hypothetical protein
MQEASEGEEEQSADEENSAGEEEADEESDVDEEGDELQREYEQLRVEEEQTVQALRLKGDKEREKGVAVVAQRKLWDHAVETRILMQVHHAYLMQVFLLRHPQAYLAWIICVDPCILMYPHTYHAWLIPGMRMLVDACILMHLLMHPHAYLMQVHHAYTAEPLFYVTWVDSIPPLR